MDSKTVFYNFMHALLGGDVEKAVSYLDPEFVIHEVNRLPYAGTYRGHDGFRTLLGKMHNFWESMEGHGEPNVIADGDIVVVLGMLKGRARSTGEVLEIPVMERHQLRNGLIVESWPFYVDTHLKNIPE